MVGCGILTDVYRAVVHVPHANSGCRRLLIDELAEIIQLRSGAWIGGIVDEHEKFQRALAALPGDPLSDLQTGLIVKNSDVLFINPRNFLPAPAPHRNTH